MIDGLGGQLYGSDKRNPFFMVLTGEGIAILIIIVLAIAK